MFFAQAGLPLPILKERGISQFGPFPNKEIGTATVRAKIE
jgi:hypothetical protein